MNGWGRRETDNECATPRRQQQRRSSFDVARSLTGVFAWKCHLSVAVSAMNHSGRGSLTPPWPPVWKTWKTWWSQGIGYSPGSQVFDEKSGKFEQLVLLWEVNTLCVGRWGRPILVVRGDENTGYCPVPTILWARTILNRLFYLFLIFYQLKPVKTSASHLFWSYFVFNASIRLWTW